jgi:hypothetical protein
MFWIGTNYHNFTVSFNYSTFITHFFTEGRTFILNSLVIIFILLIHIVIDIRIVNIFYLELNLKLHLLILVTKLYLSHLGNILNVDSIKWVQLLK